MLFTSMFVPLLLDFKFKKSKKTPFFGTGTLVRAAEMIRGAHLDFFNINTNNDVR